jgi:Phage integrase family
LAAAHNAVSSKQSAGNVSTCIFASTSSGPDAYDLRWDQVDFNGAVLHVRRVKNGTPSTHPLHGDELWALRRLQRESETSPFVFVSERGSPFTTAGFARMIERAAAGLELKAHPHMLRHACGYASPIRATTLGLSRDGSAIDRLRAPQSTRPWRLTGSRVFGGTDRSLDCRAFPDVICHRAPRAGATTNRRFD